MANRRRAALILGAMCAAVLLEATLETRRTVVRRRTLRLAGWPPALDGLRVALVGDLHVGAGNVDVGRVRKIAAAVAKQRPHALLLAGDLVDAGSEGGLEVAPEPVAAALGALRAPLGAYAVLGNHDRAYGGGRVAAALRDGGVRVLENRAVAVGDGDERFWLAVVADDASAEPDPQATLRGVPADDPVIVLTHSPDVFPRVPERVSLTVAGHTHGGQVALPWLRAWWTPSRHGERYARGHVVEGGRHLFVTSGIGTSRLPLRLGAAPEVVILTLRAAKAGPEDSVRRAWRSPRTRRSR